MTTGMDWTRLADMCDLVDQAGSRPSRFFRRILPGFHAAGDCWQDLHQYRDHQGDH